MAQQNQAIAAQQNNMALRQALLGSAPRQSKQLGIYTETSPQGKTTRVKLSNVGVITTIRLLITLDVTITTAITTVSPKAPYNAISNISLIDYEGNSRVNLTGYQLWQILSVRERTPAFMNNEGTTKNAALPVVPTAIAANQTLQFWLEIPVAYDPERDLRGAILAQVAGTGGEMSVNVTWNNAFYANGNDDAVYNGAGSSVVTVNSATIEAYQDFLFPQNLGNGVPLPMLDLMTVYALDGNMRVSDNIASGQERMLSLPNNRSVIGVYANWINNGVMADTISKFRLVANASNTLTENSLIAQQITQRKWLNGDMPKGSFFQLFRQRPIETVLYGNVQLGLTFSASPTGNAYIEQAFESFYPRGAALPGISNQG